MAEWALAKRNYTGEDGLWRRETPAKRDSGQEGLWRRGTSAKRESSEEGANSGETVGDANNVARRDLGGQAGELTKGKEENLEAESLPDAPRKSGQVVHVGGAGAMDRDREGPD